MSRSRLSSLFGLAVGYLAYAVSGLALLAGLYVGVAHVAAPAAGSGGSFGTALAVLMACGGLAIFAFAFAKAVFHMTRHPSWALDLSGSDDSIRYR
ncbi:hypothetical protein C491_01512 [Natronococcus amylolyticus DSM 10524]|uniref:Uncharacterized protein n=1 Tax=Natronococcus amylolyticus DSM 10524 TaxID=1227497 RepID=L9XIE9_9EURY|nr:hypothetical protein [Natronococcus amylolyticus]ELY61494.1 hypothetical protein C491_01512 [Natronococcus amylolyticus DSM 10524]